MSNLKDKIQTIRKLVEGEKDLPAVHMQDGGSPLDQFTAKSRGVSSLPGYGEGAQDIQQALAAIQEGPVGRIASGVGELAEGYMSGAGSTDLQKIGQGLSMIPMLGLPATVSKTIKTARVGDAITDSLRAKYPNVDISVAGDNTLYLGKMVVPKEQRNQGIGTQVMNDLVKQADDIGATVTLSPSADFGGNKEKLKEFYKRFGFVQNTGKNKDFAISESMYRTPQENLPTNFSDLGAMATQAYADYKANPNQLNALRYQRIKKAADDAYVKTQATPSKPVVTDEDYRGLHTAPTRSSGAPLHALTQTYPDDIYSSKASQYYGHGEPRDAAVVSLAQSFKGRPHQMVTVYRAVPKNAKGSINAGDWVTIDRPYAKSHGESALRGDYKILSKRVRANEIFTNGDSIYEWGYDPVEAIKKAAGGAIHMQDGGRLPPGIKRATERAKESKGVLPVAGARQARQAIQGYLGMDPSFSVMDPEAQALESAYRGGETASVLGDLFASLTPFATASALSKANQVPGLAQLIAYHGSPHKFKKFDASKIGTGEGAQAYGHGLYFAENPKVAKEYAINLANRDLANQGRLNAHANAKRLATLAGDPKYAADDIRSVLELNPEHEQAGLLKATLEMLESGDYAKPLKTQGSLYTVDIPDEKIAQMLDWDKPLSQQPKAVQDIVFALPRFQDPYIASKTTGGEAYGELAGQLGSRDEAAKMLRQQGIPGIQYLDQASRDAKQGTRNFVVFPGEEQNIKMLDINGEPQMAKGGKVRISDNPDSMLLELTNAPKMQAGGAALKAFRDKLLAQHQRSLAKDPRFKQAPGEVTNLAGKSYAQWAAEQQYKHELEDALAKISGAPEKKMSIQDLPVGSRLVSIIGDRTQADKILRSVNETPLANEVILHGGPRFGQGKLAQGKEDFWASQDKAAQGVQNRIDAAAERAKGKPVIGVYTAMSAKDSDMYAKHFAESLIEQYPFTGMTGKQVDAFNKEFRKKYPQFAGVDNPEFVDQIMANTEMRKAFVNEHLKKKNIEKFNIPDGLATRHAITVPELRDVPTGLAGYSVGEMKPGMALEKGSYLEHPTYNTVIPGRYMGGLEIMHDYRDLFPEATQRMRQTLRNNPKFQGPGARDPESQMFGTFGFQGAEQEVTQKLIDELAAREELIKQLGILPYKKGGKVKKVKVSDNPDTMRLELLRKKHA